MKFNRLYTKFLFSFLAVLVIAEVLVLILFVVVPAKHFGTRLQSFATNKARIVKEIVEDKIRSTPEVSWSRNAGLREFIADFAKIMDAKVWLTDADGIVAVKSFPEGIPDLSKEVEQGSEKHGGFKVFSRNHFGYYHAVIPIEVSGKRAGSIHVLLDRHPFPVPQPRGYFTLGFLILALTIALLIIPVSRLMTTRIKKLEQSAIRITEGDLSHRVRIAGSDEISELSRAFNGMTDKLESMIRSGRELTANVSHELRSPLTRIRLAEEMLRERLSQTDAEDWADHLDAIREEVQELDSLIGRILELSKLNVQDAPLKFESLDPSDLIRDLLDRLRPAMERAALHLNAELTYDPPFTGDSEALRSALTNVLDNAVKFTPRDGDISVHMDWMPDSVAIRVVNTFHTFSDKELALIFNPFHRTKGTATRGHGLGLTIARKAIERQGGTITARNSEKGFEILISLPRTFSPSKPPFAEEDERDFRRSKSFP
jgi:signal transduction histidine kinase